MKITFESDINIPKKESLSSHSVKAKQMKGNPIHLRMNNNSGSGGIVKQQQQQWGSNRNNQPTLQQQQWTTPTRPQSQQWNNPRQQQQSSSKSNIWQPRTSNNNKPQQQWNNPRQQQQQQRWNKPNQQQGGSTTTSAPRRPMGTGGPAKLTVRNLDVKVTEADIFTLFLEFGDITETSIHFDRNGKPIGSAHVLFKHHSEAMKGLRKYNRVTLDERPMVINVENLNNPVEEKITTTNVQANNQTGAAKKPVKRLQQGPQQPVTQKFQKVPQQIMTQKFQNRTQQVMTQQVMTQQAPQQQTAFRQPLMGMAPKQQPLMGMAPKQQSLMGMAPKQTSLMGMAPQQQLASNRPQLSYGVSNQFNNSGFGVNNMQGTGSFGEMERPSILGRLGNKTEFGALNQPNQIMPSVLDRLDGGGSFVTPVIPNNQPMPSVLTRLSGTVNSGVLTRLSGTVNSGVLTRLSGSLNSGNAGQDDAGLSYAGQNNAGLSYAGQNNAGLSYAGLSYAGQNNVGQSYAGQSQAGQSNSSGSSILNRVGVKEGVVKPAMPAMGGREWSFALPVGVPVTPKKPGNQPMKKGGGVQPKNKWAPQVPQKVNQPQKKVTPVQKNQPPAQPKGNKFTKKKTPTAEELDAELDEYLQQMSK